MSVTLGNLESSRGKRVSGTWNINKHEQDDGVSLSVDILSGLSGELRILIATGPQFTSVMSESVLKRIADKLDVSNLIGTIVIMSDFASKLNSLTGIEKPSYPGWPQGDFGEKMAFEIFNYLLKQMDYALFLEGTDPEISHLPHAAQYVLDNPPMASCDYELLKILGHDLILEKEASYGSFAIEAQRQFGLPVLISQVDEVADCDETRDWIEERVMNFLSFTKMIDSKLRMPDRTFVATKDCEIRSNSDGDIRFISNLGDFMFAGDQIGTVYDEENKKKSKIENEVDGYIVSRKHEGQVANDDVLCSMLGTEELDESPDSIACRTTLDNSDMYAEIRHNRLFHGLIQRQKDE